VSSAGFVTSENDRLYRTVDMHQVVVSDWQTGAETFQMLTFALREEAVRQTVVFDCSAGSRNGMTSVKDAEFSGCLPTGRMCRNVEHVHRIWHESISITIRKLANVLGSILVYAVKF